MLKLVFTQTGERYLGPIPNHCTNFHHAQLVFRNSKILSGFSGLAVLRGGSEGKEAASENVEQSAASLNSRRSIPCAYHKLSIDSIG